MQFPRMRQVERAHHRAVGQLDQPGLRPAGPARLQRVRSVGPHKVAQRDGYVRPHIARPPCARLRFHVDVPRLEGTTDGLRCDVLAVDQVTPSVHVDQVSVVDDHHRGPAWQAGSARDELELSILAGMRRSRVTRKATSGIAA